MINQEVIVLSLCVFVSDKEVNALSTWKTALEDCNKQCLTIESNTITLKQYFLNRNEDFWLPKAEFLSSWIEQIGCSSSNRGYARIYKASSLGLCYYGCSKDNATYFSYKDDSCECLPEFNAKVRNIETEKKECQYIIYKILENKHIQVGGIGECAVSSCKLDNILGKYVRDQFTATGCNASYNIRTICGDGTNYDNFKMHQIGMQLCNMRGSHLPGTDDNSCENIVRLHSGIQTSTMWSSVFKTTFTRQLSVRDDFSEKPTQCISGRFDKMNTTLIEKADNCDRRLSYICKANATNCLRQKDEDGESSSIAISVGVVCGVIFPVSILVLVIAVFRKRICVHCKHQNDDNITTQSTDFEQHANADGLNNPVSINKNTHHFNGTINNDEYAVINKPDMLSRLQRNTNTDGMLFITPSAEYDRLHRSNGRQSRPPDELYSKSSNYARYNTAFVNIQSNNSLNEYDHVPSHVNQNLTDDSAYV